MKKIKIGLLFLVLNLISFGQTTFYDSITNKFGIMDRFGKLILKPTYDTMYLINKNGLAIFESKGKCGLINDKGIILLKPLFEYYQLVLADDIQNDMLPLQNVDSPGNVKIGYYNTNGILKIPFKFSTASTFCNGIACVSLDGEKFNFINTIGEYLSPKWFNDWIRLNGVYYGIEENEDQNQNKVRTIYKLLNKNEITIDNILTKKYNSEEYKYMMLWILSENCHKKTKSSQLESFQEQQTRLFGYSTKDNITIIPPKYKLATDFNDNRAIVYLNDSVLIINEKDEVICNLTKKIPNLTYSNFKSDQNYVYNLQVTTGIGFINGLVQLSTVVSEVIWNGEEKNEKQIAKSYFIDLDGNIIKKGGFNEIINEGFDIE
jgi:hypothetical protein